ncbi:MAG: hypothetical protein KC646_11955 [Candidatus Cloacimonetes bacterium]|nr:hypothetical protein [Candidatus Cloacimonadota bacterium]
MKTTYIVNTFIKVSLYLFCFTLISYHNLGNDSIGVYLPTDQSNIEIKKILKKDSTYSKFRITAHSKFKELLKVSKARKYDYVIAPESFFYFNKSYKKKFTFQREGTSTFKFQVISISRTLTQKNYKDGAIALLDCTKRHDAKSYVSYLLYNQDFKKVKRVSKIEDLFPSLVFNNAQFLMIRPENLNQIRSEYTSPIYVVDESIEENYPSIGIHINNSYKSLNKPSLSIIQQLGFSSIKDLTKEQE